MKWVSVTGDVVLDCHLYGGVKTAATSFEEPGTQFCMQYGGAALTYRLLQATADGAGLLCDQRRSLAAKRLAAENKQRKEHALPSLPDPGGPPTRPEAGYGVHLGLDLDVAEPVEKLSRAQLDELFPPHLRSYGVWVPHSAREAAKEQVWRVQRHFGYGPTNSAKPPFPYRHRPLPDGEEPLLTLIDDGAIRYRHRRAQRSLAWPDFGGMSRSWVLLKTTAPICRGELWPELEAVRHRLIVLMDVRDLRREDMKINSRLSWELSVEETLRALERARCANGLLERAAHLVITFGSAGALWVDRDNGPERSGTLFFDHEALEGENERGTEGSVYGYQTCVTVGIAHALMARNAAATQGTVRDPFGGGAGFADAMKQGITSGLAARRQLLATGHGLVEPNVEPCFPHEEIARLIASDPGGYAVAEVPADVLSRERSWSILERSEAVPASRGIGAPLVGLGEWVARFGPSALSTVPALGLGKVYTVDRAEIERLRMLYGLMQAYESQKVQEKPLSIGVFGPPGAGKSFAVKALAKAILGDKAPVLEFNLSQFDDPRELIGAFHRIRDAVLAGVTPVAFWDEFDSQEYRWLQYLLAPMQDGKFQEGQITHPIGKCVFIFAGATGSTLDEFGVRRPEALREDTESFRALDAQERAEQRRMFREARDAYQHFKLRKGPDFVSRLHGYLDVLGPNPDARNPDATWPIRRALMLRGIVGLKDRVELDIDPGLLHAMLAVPEFRHGARSFEKVLLTLKQAAAGGRLQRAALPSDSLLDRETIAVRFMELMNEVEAFDAGVDIDALAAHVHLQFMSAAEQAELKAAKAQCADLAWTVDESAQRRYDELTPDLQASNRAAARRIPRHLALIDFVPVPKEEGDDLRWVEPLRNAIEHHVDRLAHAEHLEWCAERTAAGWKWAETRDNDAKHHPLILPWSKLPEGEKEKDRALVRAISEVLKEAGYKAVPMSCSAARGDRTVEEASPMR